ncbi:MAG: ATP-binding protein [Lachnospiraceae bacterium]|jgi:hypothetical protein
MNIKEAKMEIIHTIQAYTMKNEQNGYQIPLVRQRPILLIGPPGIGKTAIMEQIAEECDIGLVAYTITHHTRQSAIGLPLIEKKVFDGKEYTVTEYTMSEIIASVYDCMEKTGKREGILFIDEINCVSETLAPTMLQFLQCKTFGSHKVPDGWIIVAAGNPPEYNKSVREFDIVTLDRVKKITITEDYAVWKEYAYQRGIHGAILAYLNTKKGNFYRAEQNAVEKSFVTARGWEDLSQILFAYENLKIEFGYDLMIQYLQNEEIARDFANFYLLYRKYEEDYRIDDILQGSISGEEQKEKEQLLENAQIDERITVVGLMNSYLAQSFMEWKKREEITEALHQMLLTAKPKLEKGQDLSAFLESQKNVLQVKLDARLISEKQAALTHEVLHVLEKYQLRIKQERVPEKEIFQKIRTYFQETLDTRAQESKSLKIMLESAFRFLKRAVGKEMEMTIFVTDLSKNENILEFIEQYGCPAYVHYSNAILFQEKEQKLKEEIQMIHKTYMET